MRLLSVACVLAFAVLSQIADAVPTVGFNPGFKSGAPGEGVALVLQGSGFDLTAGGLTIDNVTGGQGFNLAFDGSLLEILNVQIAQRWSFLSGNKPGTINNTAGTLTGLAFGTFPATTDDNFEIATVTFKLLGLGQGQVAITSGVLVGKVNNVAGTGIQPVFQAANVLAIPEPEVWAMMLTGVGLIGWRIRKRCRRSSFNLPLA